MQAWHSMQYRIRNRLWTPLKEHHDSLSPSQVDPCPMPFDFESCLQGLHTIVSAYSDSGTPVQFCYRPATAAVYLQACPVGGLLGWKSGGIPLSCSGNRRSASYSRLWRRDGCQKHGVQRTWWPTGLFLALGYLYYRLLSLDSNTVWLQRVPFIYFNFLIRCGQDNPARHYCVDQFQLGTMTKMQVWGISISRVL